MLLLLLSLLLPARFEATTPQGRWVLELEAEGRAYLGGAPATWREVEGVIELRAEGIEWRLIREGEALRLEAPPLRLERVGAAKPAPVEGGPLVGAWRYLGPRGGVTLEFEALTYRLTPPRGPATEGFYRLEGGALTLEPVGGAAIVYRLGLEGAPQRLHLEGGDLPAPVAFERTKTSETKLSSAGTQKLEPEGS